MTKIGHTATAVALRSFAASRSGRSVLVRWRTASELSLAGFRLYRQTSGKPVLLNARLIPAIASAAGRSYSFRDRLPAGVRAARYWLEALRLDGTSVRFGPIRAS